MFVLKSRWLGVLLGLVVLLVLANVRTDIPVEELRLKYANEASRFVSVDGVLVHYRDEGSGRPLVLIHGTSSSLHTWDGWVQKLGPHRRIVRLDLPGFGLTGPAEDKDYSVARYARLVAALMEQLGIASADVAGNSLGGRVALTLALDYPSRVRRLVLVDSSGLSGQPLPSIFRVARTPGLNQLVRWVTPRAVYQNNVNAVYGERSRVREDVVDRYYELGRRAGNRQAMIDRLMHLSDPDLDSRLAEIRVPVLIQWGAEDRWNSVETAQRLHGAIAGSVVVVYPGVGHVPMEEVPELSAGDVERFLD